MKKFLFLAIAAAAMTSCSQDEVLEVAQKEAIAFNNGFINNATRAIDPSVTNTSVSEFQVWGTVTAESSSATTSIFKNTQVKSNNNEVGVNKIWDTQGTTQYWIAGAKYNFAGLINAGTDDTKFTLTNGLPTSVTFTQDYTAEKDLLYARSTTDIVGKASDNTAVSMTFDHMLSKVGFKVTNNNAANSGYTYKVTDIKIISALATTGTATITSTPSANSFAWAYQSGEYTNLGFGAAVAKDETEVSDAAVISETATMYSNNEHLLIPNTYNTFEVQFTLETIVNGTTIKTGEVVKKAAATAVTFAAKTYYMINIGLQVGESIQFTVSALNAWTPEAGTNVTVQ